MVKRSGWLITCVILLITNVILFNIWRKKNGDLALVRSQLTDSSGLDEYIIERNSDFLSFCAVRTDNLCQASRQFSEKIELLITSQRDLEISNAGTIDYFKNSLSVDKKVQDELASAHVEFQNVIARFLEVDIPARKESLNKLKEYIQGQYSSIEHQAQESANGSRRSIVLKLSSGAQGGIEIGWTKRNDSIFWSSGQEVYRTFMTNLNRKINSPHALQTRNLSAKLSKSFLTPGKIEVYGNIYDLTSVKRSELESIGRYLSILKATTERSVMSTAREVSQFFP